VAPAEESDKNQMDGLRLSHDDPVDILEQPFRGVFDRRHVSCRRDNRLIHDELLVLFIIAQENAEISLSVGVEEKN
jgi:hypothetical protein